jgi:hypothetical protein
MLRRHTRVAARSSTQQTYPAGPFNDIASKYGKLRAWWPHGLSAACNIAQGQNADGQFCWLPHAGRRSAVVSTARRPRSAQRWRSTVAVATPARVLAAAAWWRCGLSMGSLRSLVLAPPGTPNHLGGILRPPPAFRPLDLYQLDRAGSRIQ